MVPRRDSRGDHPSLPRYPSTMAQPKRKDAAEPPLLPERFRQWFEARGWTPRPHQLALLAKAREGRSALLVAPTGAGKTLAGFLPTLVELAEGRVRPSPERGGVGGGGGGKSRPGLSPTRPSLRSGRPALSGEGQGRLHTLYISPLKALAVDIARNLEAPAAGDGARGPRRDPHRRHAGAQARPAARAPAGHPADDPGAARAAARAPRRPGAVLRPEARHPRRAAFARHLEARRPPRARPRPPLPAGAGADGDRPLGDRARAGRAAAVSRAASSKPLPLAGRGRGGGRGAGFRPIRLSPCG